MPEFDSSYRVLRRRGEPDLRSLEAYRRAGGYSALEKAIRQQTPEQVIQQVIDAKLRGREITEAPRPQLAPVIDLMEALKKSLAQQESAPKKPPLRAVAEMGAKKPRKKTGS